MSKSLFYALLDRFLTKGTGLKTAQHSLEKIGRGLNASGATSARTAFASADNIRCSAETATGSCIAFRFAAFYERALKVYLLPFRRVWVRALYGKHHRAFISCKSLHHHGSCQDHQQQHQTEKVGAGACRSHGASQKLQDRSVNMRLNGATLL